MPGMADEEPANATEGLTPAPAVHNLARLLVRGARPTLCVYGGEDREPAGAGTSRWQTVLVPVVEGQGFLQVALIAGLIGLLGLVLRWTFRRDSGLKPRKRSRRRTPTDWDAARPVSPPPSGPVKPEATSSTASGGTPGTRTGRSGAAKSGRRGDRAKDSTGSETRSAQTKAPGSGSGAGITPTPPQREDYGLLAVAAEGTTAEEIAAVRRALTAAGIRNTNTVSADGKQKVLVFGHELIKARRVAGGSQGANGSGGS